MTEYTMRTRRSSRTVGHLMLLNPKRTKSGDHSKESWFSYYAGYSDAFVRQALPHLLPDGQGRVLDPWNGSGTTTAVAHALGLDSFGFDINPAMVVVAKSKLVSPSDSLNIAAITESITTNFEQLETELDRSDLLLEWFAPSSARALRNLFSSICRNLECAETRFAYYNGHKISNISSLAAFFMVGAFRTTRSYLSRFCGSNPTWIKVPRSEKFRCRPSRIDIVERFNEIIVQMQKAISPFNGEAETNISLGQSTCLPLSANCVDLMISSPPYCTRIDYAVATKPELAVLGYDANDLSLLRHQMIGGPVINSDGAFGACDEWGASCLEFLESVNLHGSKGSSSYYYKTLAQYFNGIYKSMNELKRILRKDSKCVLVVQDSFYKEIHIDLAKYISEMAVGLRWNVEDRFDFQVSRNLSRVNSKIYKYRDVARAVESVIIFRSESS